MKKRAANISISSETSFGNKELNLDEGQVVNLALYHQNFPNKSVNIKIEDDRGEEIIPSIPFQEFKPGNGEYLKSRMPVSFKAGRKVNIVAKATGNLSEDFSFDLVFYIDQNKLTD
jgi:hypothetical protein